MDSGRNGCKCYVKVGKKLADVSKVRSAATLNQTAAENKLVSYVPVYTQKKASSGDRRAANCRYLVSHGGSSNLLS